MASIVSRNSRWSFTLAGAITTPRGPPSASTSTLSLVPFFPRSVGFFPTFFPPEAGLAQTPVRRLPLPVHGPQLVALLDQLGPDTLHDATGAPALEPVVDGALGTELTRQLLPLAAGTQAEDDAVERPSPVGVVAAGAFARPEILEDGQDPLPEGVGHFPDSPQGLSFAGLLSLGLRLGGDHGLDLRGDTSFLLNRANSMP